MKAKPPIKIPTLARRRLELLSLGLPNATVSMLIGKELIYEFSLKASAFGRLYRCRLHLKPDSRMPEVFVIEPNLSVLAADKKIPHIYSSPNQGTKLCLWLPKRREWMASMKLQDTYIAWTAEWLWYFEDWLVTGEWAGGGEHPQLRSTDKPSRKARAQVRPERNVE